jgi:gluconolactonase
MRAPAPARRRMWTPARAPHRLCIAAALLFLRQGCLPLAAQIPDQVETSRVAASLGYATGLAWSRDGFLVIADELKREIFRLDADQRPKPTGQDTNNAQGLAYDTQSRLYICEAATRQLVRLDKKGKFETVAESFEGKKLNSPTAVTVRRDGQVYFTDAAFAGAIDKRELSFNGIFHVNPKGEIEAVARWQTRPNGIALSADGKKLFVSDADRHAVVEFELDSKGAAANPHDFITGIQGVPAGLCVDVGGRLYVGALGLAIYAPDGKLMRTLLGSERVISCTFGSVDLELLYVSTPHDVYRARVGVKGALQY